MAAARRLMRGPLGGKEIEGKSTLLKRLTRRIVRKLVWTGKKKSVVQVLTPRCRRDGEPEYGRFTSIDIDRIILHANSNIEELMPYFKDFDNLGNLGNYLWEFGGLVDLAIYKALVKEEVDPNYAMTLIGDMIWQARVNAKGLIPVIDPLRLKLVRMTTKDPMAFLEKRLRGAMEFPYSEPGYKVKLYRDKNVYCMDFYSCPVYGFYRQFGNEEMALFRGTWCTFDYAVAENLVEGGKYEREHTLSDGDDFCDMKWSVNSQVSL